ncbi:hypothetical protein TWF281_006970 [Arthrobotrys megalospora]
MLETPPVSSRSLSEQTQSSTPQEPDAMVLENNGDLIVGDRFWTIFCGEVERIFEAARGPEPYSFEIHNEATPDSDSHTRSHINYYNFLLRQANAAAKYDLLHPHPSQMLLIWQTYVDDIDPFVKILHVPSMTRLIRDLRGQYHSLKPATEALIFSISLAAVSISSEEDIPQHFNVSKRELISRYRLCTEKSFEKAELLTSDDLQSLQALAIYLYTLRENTERKAVWTLSGILLRIALRLNLHKETTDVTGPPAIEREAKRRLWWQICLTDSASEFRGVSKFLISEDMFDTPMPSDIDDADINMNSLNIPDRGARRTDLTIFRIRCEIWRLSRRLQSLIVSREASQRPLTENPTIFFQTARKRITEDYLKYLRLDVPLDCFVHTMTQLFFTKVDLSLLENYTKENAEPHTENQLLILATSILDYTYSLQNEPTWEPWRWHIQSKTPPYRALAIVLNKVCSRQWDSTSEQALSSALSSFASIPEGTSQHSYFAKLINTAQSRKESHFFSTQTQTELQPCRPDLGPPGPLVAQDEFAPASEDDFNFTTVYDAGDFTNFATWDDIFEPWEFGGMGRI